MNQLNPDSHYDSKRTKLNMPANWGGTSTFLPRNWLWDLVCNGGQGSGELAQLIAKTLTPTIKMRLRPVGRLITPHIHPASEKSKPCLFILPAAGFDQPRVQLSHPIPPLLAVIHSLPKMGGLLYSQSCYTW